jgi:hypothetical protein
VLKLELQRTTAAMFLADPTVITQYLAVPTAGFPLASEGPTISAR